MESSKNVIAEFEDEISGGYLSCNRCKNTILDHYISECGHVFCHDCHLIIDSNDDYLCAKCQFPIKSPLTKCKTFGEELSLCDVTNNNNSGTQKVAAIVKDNNITKKAVKTEKPKDVSNFKTFNGVKIKPKLLMKNKVNKARLAEAALPIVPNSRAIKFQAIPGKTYNVLLLGQTGVGKSTFINAFYNYHKFGNLAKARNGNPSALIACKFTISDENYQLKTVHFGSDANESTKEGQSCTQQCKAYEFPVRNYTLRMIDTPGIGDTRGVDHDRSNFEQVLEFIANYEELYGICILLKPDEARLTPFFAFCIKQLLCHLHQKASKNILFVFTNCRSNFYRPGETLTPLKEILKQVRKCPPYPKIPLDKENIFCLDNEAFRFLMAAHNGLQFPPSDFESFAQSWTKSVEETYRMIKHMVECDTPHTVLETLAVNDVRKAILNLSQPLTDIAKNIQSNLQVLNERKVEIRACENDAEKLKKCLYLPKITLKITEMDHPATVCAGDKCRVPYNVGEKLVSYHYPQKCHDPCSLKEIPKEVVGIQALQHCWAMEPDKINCRICGCHYLKHLHIYYNSEEVETQIEDESVQTQLKSRNGAMEAARTMVQKLEDEIGKYQRDEDTLSKYVARLAVYLKQNAMIVCNDSFKDHLTQVIENEKSQNEIGSRNAGIISGLEKMLRIYETEKKMLDVAMNNNDNKRIEIEEVFEIIEKIKAMPMCGLTFSKALTFQTNSTLDNAATSYFQRAKKVFSI